MRLPPRRFFTVRSGLEWKKEGSSRKKEKQSKAKRGNVRSKNTIGKVAPKMKKGKRLQHGITIAWSTTKQQLDSFALDTGD
jgi:hypothetical protein